MTTPKKLKILGPYTPDHSGPFARGPVGIKECQVHIVVGDVAFITVAGERDTRAWSIDFIHNAEYVQEPREFWINEYPDGDLTVFEREEAAQGDATQSFAGVRTIHVREVLPGEGE